MKQIKYTKQDLEIAVLSSQTLSDVCRKLGLKPAHYTTRIKEEIVLYNLDISHFVNHYFGDLKKDEDVFKIHTKFDYTVTRKRLRRYKEYLCSECGLDEWNSKPITLDVDHINGDNTDNRLENLRYLCPNCHRQTDTWGNRKRNNNG